MNDHIPKSNSGSHPQTTDSTTIEGYLNGLAPYDDFQPDPQSSHDDFMWDPNLFTNSQMYSPSVASHTPAWNQNAAAQARDPPLAGYGGLQSTFQLSQYSHPSFDHPHHSPRPDHESRLIPGPSPVPTQYGNESEAMPMAYRDASFSNQQQFNPQAMVYPNPAASAQTATFDANTDRSPYFNYDSSVVAQPQLQGMELSNELSGFPEQSQQRHGLPYIDPSFLTANNVQHQPALSSQSMYLAPRQDTTQTQPAGRQNATLGTPSNVQSGEMHPNHQAAFMGVFVPSKPDKPREQGRKTKDPNAPKRPRGRPRKDESHAWAKPGADASASDTEIDDLQVVESPEPVPDLLRGPPPGLPEDKVIYDIAVAVWFPRNRPAVVEKVRQGIALFGDVVKKQRDAWKVKNEALKQAELANTSAIPSLKYEVAQFRNTIETVAVQALRFGHPAHLAKLGENPFTMSALQSFLVDRITALDMDGTLVNGILKLMARFTTLDEEMLEKTKTSKILTRLTKKAGSEVKSLAQSVLDHAASASKRKAATLAISERGGSPVNAEEQHKLAGAASLKRPREADGGVLPATKRTVVPASVRQASKPLALQNAERKKMESAAIRAKTAGLTADGVPGNAPSATSKPFAPTALPSNAIASPFSDLRSASKKPGTSNAARAAAAKDKPMTPTLPPNQQNSPPPTDAKPEAHAAPAPKSTFSFMDTLADMSRPKPTEEKKPDEVPLETEEERERRLRKEARKKLRVSWAPENELTQVKLFVHDPEEETGHADSARRDVDDVGGEGRMLKLHKGLEDLEDDDEGRMNTDDMATYYAPTEVDFGVIDEAARQIAFVKRGGTGQPESGEKEAQDAREQTTLMVVYALPSDVPPTPKEPPATGDEDDYAPLTSLGEPEEKTRQREDKYYEQQRTSQAAVTPAPDITSILNLMKQNQALSASQPAYNSFAAQPALQQQQAQGVDISKILAVMSQLQQPSQPQTQPAVPQLPPQQAQQTQQAGGQLNIATLLAQLQGQQDPANPTQATFGGYGYNYASNPNTYAGIGIENDYFGNNKNARLDTASNGGEYDDYAWKRRKPTVSGGGNGNGGAVKPHPKAKTVICKFWQEGKCKKGDDCTFIHD